MILSTLDSSSRIEGLHPAFKTLFDFVKNNDLFRFETGRIVLDDDRLFINNVHPEMMSAQTQVLEVHRDYIDVHIPLDRTEVVAWKPTAQCQSVKTDYQEDGDFALFTDEPANYVTVMPGEFLIVYPEDAHGPLIGEGKIRKLIAKVKLTNSL